jgi:hypothetical protein
VKIQQFFKKELKSHVDSFSNSNRSHEANITDQDLYSDPTLRSFISHYNPNERDKIHRYYLTNDPYQP